MGNTTITHELTSSLWSHQGSRISCKWGQIIYIHTNTHLYMIKRDTPPDPPCLSFNTIFVIV